MSHRKHKNQVSNDRAEERARIDEKNWKAAAIILDLFQASKELSQRPDISSKEFCRMLEYLDNSRTIFSQFDPKALESIAPKDRLQFLKYYHPACVTGAAKKLHVLEVLEKYRLVAFRNPAKVGILSPIINYPELEPVLPPIRTAYPYFSNIFMGALQSHLEEILANAHLLPTTTDSPMGKSSDDQLQFKKRIERTLKLLPTRRLLTETRTAIEKYLNTVILHMEPSLVEDIADIGSAIVFLWLMAIGNFNEMIYALLRGKALLARVPLAEGQYGYIVGEKRTGVHVSCLEAEEE